jgi:hypothetical protein
MAKNEKQNQRYIIPAEHEPAATPPPPAADAATPGGDNAGGDDRFRLLQENADLQQRLRDMQQSIDAITNDRNRLHSEGVDAVLQLNEIKAKYETAATRVVEVEQLLADAGEVEHIAGPASIFIGEDNNVVATTLSLDWGADLEQAQAAIAYAESLHHSYPDKARAVAASLANDPLPGVPNGDVSVRIRARQLLKAMDQAAHIERERAGTAPDATQAAATVDSFASTG